MSAHCSRGVPTDHSYFVVMIDHGRKGLEAIVDPEITRREVISRIQSREYDRINFIHFIDDGICEDVTNDILKEAGFYERTELPNWHPDWVDAS